MIGGKGRNKNRIRKQSYSNIGEESSSYECSQMYSLDRVHYYLGSGIHIKWRAQQANTA